MISFFRSSVFIFFNIFVSVSDCLVFIMDFGCSKYILDLIFVAILPREIFLIFVYYFRLKIENETLYSRER